MPTDQKVTGLSPVGVTRATYFEWVAFFVGSFQCFAFHTLFAPHFGRLTQIRRARGDLLRFFSYLVAN